MTTSRRACRSGACFSCPEATKVYDIVEFSLANPAAANADALKFVTDCTAEMASNALLPFVDSNQAIRDIEDFRQAIGAPKVWLYGESYGTQFVQGTPVPQGHGLATSATVRGGISWPKDSGTTVQFAGDSAIIPCLRTCSAGETPGGPTRGCT